MSHKKMDYIAKLENAIADRWGDIAADNPRKYITEKDKEKYEEEMEELSQKIFDSENEDKKVHRDGYVVSESLINKEGRERCVACGCYSFKSRDDIYLSRFGTCQKCYIQYIEGREERWENGWRPNDEN